jgi:3-phosphoglycerate kinase
MKLQTKLVISPGGGAFLEFVEGKTFQQSLS